MKLLVIDHNALGESQRLLYRRIAELGGIEIKLIVPSMWHNGFRMMKFSPHKETPSLSITSLNVLLPTRTHRLLYRSLEECVSGYRPDVLYINAEPENFQTFQSFRVARKHGIPFVFSSWRNIDHHAVGYPYKLGFVHKFIERRVLTSAHHGILFNKTAKQLYASEGFNKTTFIPPHIDTDLFVPQDGEKSKRGGFTIGYVGRLIQAKGVDLILHALTNLPRYCHAMIVGDGPERQKLMELAIDLQLAERVKFIKPVETSELPRLFGSMDVLTLPSITTRFWKEQYGRVLIEAMACGTPVMGSNSGEIPAVIGDAGIVFKENDADAFVLGIGQLLSNEGLRKDLSRRGRDRVLKQNALQVVARQYHRVFTLIGNSLNME